MKEISFYYANIIGYVRLLLLIIISFTLQSYIYITSILIFFATLLDYIDGPIARKYNQCSMFGHINDWVADLGAQLINFIWWGCLNPQMIPILFIIFMI